MKIFKKYWNELHLEFNFLSNKNLRDQASLTEKNEALMAMECETVLTNVVENITLNEDNCLKNNNITSNEDSYIDNSFLSLNPSQEALLEILRPMFQCNYKTIKDQSIAKGFIQQNVIRNYLMMK